MQIIEAEYSIVTPMFIEGADNQSIPEIRPPSIKGALRFWWRALQWSKCLQNHTGSTSDVLRQLHQEEAQVFGAAAADEKYGQGKVLLKVKRDSRKHGLLQQKRNEFTPSSGEIYLLGQGLYQHKEKALKDAISPGQSFTVVLSIKDDTDPTTLINALMIFGLLGGLGSRSRKGWGSVAIRSLSYTDKNKQHKSIPIPDNQEDYKTTLTQYLSVLDNSIPPFSAFSKNIRIDISASANTAVPLLKKIGDEMQLYRSYGSNQNGHGYRVNNIPAEQNFKTDHDVVWQFTQGQIIKNHPKRVIFGLPHNYVYSSRAKVDVEAENLSRRASPLIIHIHQFSSGQCIAVQSLMIADFLPKSERIQLKSKKTNKSQALACDIDWSVITDYLDRFSERERVL